MPGMTLTIEIKKKMHSGTPLSLFVEALSESLSRRRFPGFLYMAIDENKPRKCCDEKTLSKFNVARL